MTTGENIDNMDNVTVTSDEAYERVTNDEHFEDERDGGYLQQNTSGLVQEIPNISILDIGDTFLETKKTLADKAGYVLVVGDAGKSIEAKPLPNQSAGDMLYTRRESSITLTPDGNGQATIPLNHSYISQDATKFQAYNNGIKILEDGMYRISFGWGIETTDATWFRAGVYYNTYSDWVAGAQDQVNTDNSILKGGHSTPTWFFNGDYITLRVWTNATDCTFYGYDTYLWIEYISPFIQI